MDGLTDKDIRKIQDAIKNILTETEKNILLTTAKSITEFCAMEKEKYRSQKEKFYWDMVVQACNNGGKIMTYLRNGQKFTGKIIKIDEKKYTVVLSRLSWYRQNINIHITDIAAIATDL